MLSSEARNLRPTLGPLVGVHLLVVVAVGVRVAELLDQVVQVDQREHPRHARADNVPPAHKQLLSRNVKRFRGGLVCKAHRLVYHSEHPRHARADDVPPADKPRLTKPCEQDMVD